MICPGQGPVVLVRTSSAVRQTKWAEVPGYFAITAGAASGPRTLAAVARTSAVVASAAMTVTAAGPVTPIPVRGSTMWL